MKTKDRLLRTWPYGSSPPTPKTMVLIQKEREGATPAEYVAANLTPTLTQGLMALCQARPKDPVTFLGEWLLAHKAESEHTVHRGRRDHELAPIRGRRLEVDATQVHRDAAGRPALPAQAIRFALCVGHLIQIRRETALVVCLREILVLVSTTYRACPQEREVVDLFCPGAR